MRKKGDNMIDWKRKLSSRKLWVAIAGFVAGIMIYLGKSETEATQVSGIIMSAGSVIAYILTEGWIDKANAGYVYEQDPEEEEND